LFTTHFFKDNRKDNLLSNVLKYTVQVHSTEHTNSPPSLTDHKITDICCHRLDLPLPL